MEDRFDFVGTNHLSERDTINLIKQSLTPSLSDNEDRPPNDEDFMEHTGTSLLTLRHLVKSVEVTTTNDALLPYLLLICSEHANIPGVNRSPWTSDNHIKEASTLIKRIESMKTKSISALLLQEEGKMYSQLHNLLQPALKKFVNNPASVLSYLWLTSQILEPNLNNLVPKILPHALNWLDCWIPYFKIFGCLAVNHIITNCTAHELKWFGRADLLHDALISLVHHNDVDVVVACKDPLLNVTDIRHDNYPSKPSAADFLLKELISSIELSSEMLLINSFKRVDK